MEAIVLDKKRVLPASAWLQGEYGLKDVYCGVPVKLGRNGLEQILDVTLTDQERKDLHTSAEAVRSMPGADRHHGLSGSERGGCRPCGAPEGGGMWWVRSFYQSTVGKKVVMALTGVILVGFVCGHMLGKLLTFQGPEALNAWGELLKSSAAVLWTVRIGLLVSVRLHIHAAYALTRLNWRARPPAYDRQVKQISTFSATSLRVGGVVLLVFIVFHLMHLTTGQAHPAFRPADVYGNVIDARQHVAADQQRGMGDGTLDVRVAADVRFRTQAVQPAFVCAPAR